MDVLSRIVMRRFPLGQGDDRPMCGRAWISSSRLYDHLEVDQKWRLAQLDDGQHAREPERTQHG
jgi:hypothetical protein